MKTVLSYYNRIINIGVTNEMSFGKKLRTRLSNQCVSIAALFTIIHIISILIVPSSPYELYISFSWLTIFSTTLFLNYKGLHNQANTFLIVLAMLQVGLIHHLFGPMTKLEPMYLCMVMMTFFIIKSQYKAIITICILIVYVTNTLAYPYIGAPLESMIVEKAAFEYFIFSVLLSGTLINKMLLENKNNHKLLKLQNKKMQTQNEELKRFNYIISHDLKEPIRSIVGLTGLLEKKNKGAHKDITDEIVSLGRRLNNMVDDIVKFQELDKIAAKVDTINLSELIENIKESLPDDLKNKSPEIILTGLTEITSSRTCVYLILKNLIENGIKYNNNAPIVRIDCQRNLMAYVIEVSDNGIGIPDTYHEEVFVMFKRLEQLKDKKGTGLGLSISKKLAQKYDAELNIVSSSESEGTTFRLTIPLHVSVLDLD